ncbi:hypothetical protein HF1_04410 [Mycoplasma haemofelis str. Langford 1]|uniref:Uncharacterized protein n=1 Tax=Mycoplasma haemofelis (strain Langford 1) TaxID=941640 RepID=E8ZH28_MYCHL|nr:hypothetical protein [Mycoplasma haemofelis]CBY92449.1 hypothetical protein HF1_04410 [Mycoplasma haemofelis str. Langford 1]
MVKYGLASAAAMGAAGTGVWYSGILSDTSLEIASLIKEDKTIILVKDEGDWGKQWELYKNDNSGKKANEDTWRLKGWTNPAPSTILETFKNMCSSVLSEKVKGKEDKKYQEVVKYCARDKKISDLFSEKKATLLAKTGKDNDWKTRWEKFQKDSSASLLGFSIASGDTKDKNFSKLADACEMAFNKPIRETAYLNNFESIQKWCSSETQFS